MIAAYLGTSADEADAADLEQPELHRIDTDVALDELVGQAPAARPTGAARQRGVPR